MFKYIAKRILIFIPTFFIISLLIFGLSKMAPGDPVELVLQGGNPSGEGQRSDLVNSELNYLRQAQKMGLDKPSFYFSLTSSAYPADLFEIRQSNHREMVTHLIDQYGNSDEVLAYYKTLKNCELEATDIPEDADFELRRKVRKDVSDLYLDYEDEGILFKLNSIKENVAKDPKMAFLQPAVTELESKYQAIKDNAAPMNLYIPAIRWYGFANQYHTWMFGDYPWFGQPDTSANVKIKELTDEMSALAKMQDSIGRLDKNLQYEVEDIEALLSEENTPNADSLTTALTALKGTRTQYQSQIDAAEASINRLSDDRSNVIKTGKFYSSYGFLRGDFGISYMTQERVSKRLWSALWLTLIINFLAILISYSISIFWGVKSAQWKLKNRTTLDNASTAILFTLYSLPSFWLGVLLLAFLSFTLGWFPLGGLPDDDAPYYYIQLLWYLALPLICISLGSFAFLARQMRGSLLGVMRQDYIRTAKAKGLNEGKIIWKHAFRNSLFPIITIFSSIFPRALAGSIAIEFIYQLPGMGDLVLGAIVARDWPIVFTVAMLAAILTMIGNLVADILYAVVDPRVSYD